jgi:hypothetical protein
MSQFGFIFNKIAVNVCILVVFLSAFVYTAFDYGKSHIYFSDPSNPPSLSSNFESVRSATGQPFFRTKLIEIEPIGYSYIKESSRKIFGISLNKDDPQRLHYFMARNAQGQPILLLAEKDPGIKDIKSFEAAVSTTNQNLKKAVLANFSKNYSQYLGEQSLIYFETEANKDILKAVNNSTIANLSGLSSNKSIVVVKINTTTKEQYLTQKAAYAGGSALLTLLGLINLLTNLPKKQKKA